MLSVFDSRYRLKNPIGSGGFGSVFVAEDVQARREVAVKVQTNPAKHQELHNEAEIYQLLKNTTGFPTYYSAGCDSDRHYIALELLGKPISALLREHDRKFTLKTCLMLIDQMLVRIEYIHDKGYIHRDIKPANFLMGIGSKSNTVHLIDFGLSARYLDSHGVHIRGNNWQEFVGTPIFASVNSMSDDCVSRRDDMQSLGYVFIYLMCGTLPWREAMVGTDEKALFSAMLASKMEMSVDKLCGSLPEEFAKYMKAVLALEFEERPDYAGYRQMFRDLFIRSGFVYDYRFDWLDRLKPQLSFSTDLRRQIMLSESNRTQNNSASLIPQLKVTAMSSRGGPHELSASNSQYRHLRQFVNVKPGQMKPPKMLTLRKPE